MLSCALVKIILPVLCYRKCDGRTAQRRNSITADESDEENCIRFSEPHVIWILQFVMVNGQLHHYAKKDICNVLVPRVITSRTYIVFNPYMNVKNFDHWYSGKDWNFLILTATPEGGKPGKGATAQRQGSFATWYGLISSEYPHRDSLLTLHHKRKRPVIQYLSGTFR